MSSSPSREEGESLIELIISIAILGIVFAAIVGGVFAAQRSSDNNRRASALSVALRDYAEAVKALPASEDGCLQSDFAGLITTVDAAVTPAAPTFWTGTAFTSSPCSTLQKVRLTANDPDGRVATQSLEVVRRR